VPRFVGPRRWDYVGAILTISPETRIQLCGNLVARIRGRDVQDLLPGRQGRLLFVYLVLHRTRPARREELVESIWPLVSPAAPESALRALLSKLRAVAGADLLDGRGSVRLCLPQEALVDLEAARAALHRAESAIAQGSWAQAWGPAQVALFTTSREFMPGEDAPWIAEQRRELEDLHTRALESYGTACLHVAGTELPAAERAGRELARLAPYRETGHRLLIEALAERGNLAEALLSYERLRELLRRELGISPSAETRELHARLLAAT
jgi:SARP family transcriptional regulator, regulator of embCAB operon